MKLLLTSSGITNPSIEEALTLGGSNLAATDHDGTWVTAPNLDLLTYISKRRFFAPRNPLEAALVGRVGVEPTHDGL